MTINGYKIGDRIKTSRGDVATVIAVKPYTGGNIRLIVRWDDSRHVSQGRAISYHSLYGNSVWASDVEVAI